MIKIDRIISVSSEDPAWPAENLLKGEGKNTKWKCKGNGEKTAVVVLQLDKSSKIKSIDVGNENSAFIEISVGKSCLPDANYQVLLGASSLMTVKEAKDLTNSNSVRFFKESNFCNSIANEKWDRIKIACSQPYNKHVQYGLSFIKFHGSDQSQQTLAGSDEKKNLDTFGGFVLKEDNSDKITAGSLFARRKEFQAQEKEKTSAASIRAATSQLSSENNNISKKPTTSEVTPTSKNRVSNTKRATPMNDPSDVPERKKVRKDPPSSLPSPATTPKAATKPAPRINPVKTPTISTPAPIIRRKPCKPFNEFLSGVVFTISGFQNPYRSDIRNKALAMGAKYKGDWDNTCTHLICAFPNTPKFNQVQGHGKIVKKEWIEECYSKRIRLPWRRFALDPPDGKKPESEDEIFEQDENEPSSNGTDETPDPGPRNQKRDQPGPSLFGDLSPKKKMFGFNPTNAKKAKIKDEESDDNSQKCNGLDSKPGPSPKKQKKNQTGPTLFGELQSRKNINIAEDSKETVYLDLNLDECESRQSSDLADTDSDPEWIDRLNETPEDENSPLPYLPEQFTDLSFFIADDVSPTTKALIKRYIIAHAGNVLEECNQSTEYVIAEKSETIAKLKEDYLNIMGVQPEWVWRCHDENRLLPTSKFEL